MSTRDEAAIAKRIFRGAALRAARSWTKNSLRLRARVKTAFACAMGARIASDAVYLADSDGDFTNLEIAGEAAVGFCQIQLLAEVRIGRRAIVNDGVRLLTGQHSLSDLNFSLTTSPIVLGEYSWVATGATILPGVTIGAGAVVAAGAIVTRSVEPNNIVGGVPARVIGRRTSASYEYLPGLVEFLRFG